MSHLKFQFPVLVQNSEVDGKTYYNLRPLFLMSPTASHVRYESALSMLKKEISHYLKGFVFSHSSSSELLWFLYSPDLEYFDQSLSFSTGSQYINGNFAVIRFQAGSQTIVMLPEFENYMYISKVEEKKSRLDIEELTTVLQQLIRAYKKGDKDFDITPYYSTKGEFVVNMTMSQRINYGNSKFNKPDFSNFFSRINEQAEFDGSIEIEKVGQNLNDKQLSRAYLRDEMVERIYQITYQKENTPFVLTGPIGVGKMTIIEEVIQRYLDRKKDPDRLGRAVKKVWHVDPNRIISGMSIVGWWQKRTEAIIDFLVKKGKFYQAPNGEDILLIDNPIALLRIGKSAQNNMTITDLLKPYLEKRSLQVIMLASPEQWKIVQEKNRRFSDLFQVIRVPEPDYETSIRIVLEERKNLEAIHGCQINIQAISQLFNIQRNYLRGQALPGSVMKLLNQLSVKYRYQVIDSPEVRKEFESLSGLNEYIFDSNFQLSNDEITDSISAELVGQPQAVDALVNVINIMKAKLNTPGKPLGSFLFIGPTGVGKTQAAKVLCQYLTGNENQLIRFDMNEYIDAFAIDRLIGDYNNPDGILTERVRYQPFGIILFDEIEKANPLVHDLLLQVLDDGRLTDSLGRTVDFSNNIIIMTSNVGAREVSVQLGFESSTRNDEAIYRKAMENKFRPEFINRIDRIVIFDPLQLEHILKIARLQIRELLQRDGFVRRTTILNISKEALEWVARRGFDARMGGRALKRQIEKDLTALSAEQLISSHTDLPDIFDIDIKNGKLIPKITTFEFTEPMEGQWIPELPDETKGRRFYGKLLKEIEQIERKIRRAEDRSGVQSDGLIPINTDNGSDLNWQYYQFKDKVVETKQRITDISLGFRDKYFKEGPAIPLRLKGGTIVQRRFVTDRAIKERTKDWYFQQEALIELQEQYKHMNSRFDSMQTELLDAYLDVVFLKLFSKDFLSNKTQKVQLQFHTWTDNDTSNEIGFLIDLYQELFKEIDIQHTINKDKHHIVLEGHGIYELLSGEQGIHLFYRSHQNPVPIRIRLVKDGVKPKESKKAMVIRIYNRNSTLTDLRTNLTNDVQISPSEFKLLIFAGLKQVPNLSV